MRGGSWVNQLEDRQRVALKSAKREKNISNSLSRGKDNDYRSDPAIGDIDDNSSTYQDNDRETEDMISDIMGVRSDTDGRGTSESDLEFISQYEKVVDSNGDDDSTDGQEEGEGKAIDRALKLLGLDGKR